MCFSFSFFFSTEAELQPKVEANDPGGITPDIGPSKKTTSFLTVKTPAAANRQRQGLRTPFSPITPQSVAPIKEKCFIPPRGVVPPVLIFSNSDDESPPAKDAKKVTKDVEAPNSKTTKENRGCRPTSTATKKKLIDVGQTRESSEPACPQEGPSALRKDAKGAGTSTIREKRAPRAEAKFGALSDSEDVIDSESDLLNTGFLTPKPRNQERQTVKNNVQKSAPQAKKTALKVKESDKPRVRAKKDSADKPCLSSIRSTRARKLM